MSALPAKADICQRIENVCLVPKADILAALCHKGSFGRVDNPGPLRVSFAEVEAQAVGFKKKQRERRGTPTF